MIYVSPCTGRPLLAGQGTVGLEILEELPSVRTLVVPVGGGGLAGGIAVLVRAVAPHVRIVGAQSELTNAMAASLTNGRRTTIPVVRTLADGLAGQVDDEGVLIGRFALDEIVVVTEREIADSMRWLARMHGARVEGSGAVGVAALLSRGGWDGPVTGDREWRQRRSERVERDRGRAGRRRVATPVRNAERHAGTAPACRFSFLAPSVGRSLERAIDSAELRTLDVALVGGGGPTLAAERVAALTSRALPSPCSRRGRPRGRSGTAVRCPRLRACSGAPALA